MIDDFDVPAPTMHELVRDSWPRRIARYLRQWQQRQGRIVSGQMLRGASYSVGSGAVSLIIIWFETRR
ncbi:hypothetical protein ACRJ4B_26490 [Streptomyces sp. GTA36]